MNIGQNSDEVSGGMSTKLKRRTTTLQFASSLLLSCAVVNYAILLAWFVTFKFAHAWMSSFGRPQR
jgi:hypothetical protein